jgi:L-asparaginase
VSTRVPHGAVAPLYGFDGGGATLKEASALFAGDLGPHKARILLMLALQSPRTPGEIQMLFDR